MCMNYYLILAQWWNHPKSRATANFNRKWIPISNLFGLILHIVPLISTLPVLLDPKNPAFFPNIFPPDTFIHFVVYVMYIPSFVYAVYQWTYIEKTILLVSSAIMILLVPLVREELNVGVANNFGRKFQTTGLRHNPENVVFVYRSLQLFEKLISIAIGPFIPICQAIFSQIFIYTGYILIVDRENLDASFSLVLLTCIPSMMICWVTFLAFAAKVHKGSQICIRSWTFGATGWSQKDTKYMGKFGKSCKPLSFGYPGIMMITHKTVVNFVQGNVRGLFRTVLELRKGRFPLH